MGKNKKKVAEHDSNEKYVQQSYQKKQIKRGRTYMAECRQCGNYIAFHKNGTVCSCCKYVQHYTDPSKDFDGSKEYKKIKKEIISGKDVFK